MAKREPILNGINNPIPDEPNYPIRRRNFPTSLNPKEYRYIGKNCPRKDAKDIVTGKAIFLDDYTVPGMVIGKSLKSPYAHALIKSIDVEEARKLPGIHAILTYKDVEKLNPMLGWPRQKPLLDRHLRYVGDSVALIAGDTEEIVLEAMELIQVEYEVLDAVYDGLAARQEGAPQLYDNFANNIVPGGYRPMQQHGDFWHLVRGDVEEGFKECSYIAEDTISFSSMCAPAPPEPPGTIVRWEGDLNFTIWGTAQSSFILKLVNESVIMGSKVKALTFNVGGSYGNKQSLTLEVIAGALLSMACNRPVKFFETKVEQMINHETRLGSQVHAKIGMDQEGIIRAVKADWTVDTGAFCNSTQGQVSVGIGEAQLIMAKCQHWDLDTNIVVTNKQPAGIVRGYGGQELNSCLSLLINRVMEAGNFDPIEVYKKNYVSDGDCYIWRDGLPWRAHTVDYTAFIEAAAKKFNWQEKWKGWGKPTWTSPDGRYVRGVGCSLMGNADVGEDCNEVYVRITPGIFDDEFRVTVHADITEIGNGERSNALKVVAEMLNCPYEAVSIVPSGGDYSPVGISLGGSRGTITFGHSLANACEDLKRQIFKLAEVPMGISADSMELKDFHIVSHAIPGLKLPLKELLNRRMTFTGYGKHVENFSTPSCVMCFVEVQVDKETGKADVVHMLGATDCGQIIDPATLEMQAQSAIGCACLDTAFFEEHILDPATGRQLTFNLLEYKWRPFNQFPKFDTFFMESRFDTFQFHAIGTGEIAGAAAASAAMTAISNAIGVHVTQYPATPDVILKALGKL